ncbi:MAG: mercuric transporter MerT family protein [Hydrogenobacter thermophilus]|nr:mercuric transporter MerT family protein [Hydrogenobacter thermophilus]
MREALGSIVGAVASFLASSCCIAPTLFVVFGTSAGSLSSLSALEPYRWYFLAVGYGSVLYSIYRLYMRKKLSCACNEPFWTQKLSRGLAWVSLVLLIVATFYPYVLAKIYGG